MPPPRWAGTRPRITAGEIRNTLLARPYVSNKDENVIEGSFRLSGEIAHRGMAFDHTPGNEPIRTPMRNFEDALAAGGEGEP
jgi:hypothetical protein